MGLKETKSVSVSPSIRQAVGSCGYTSSFGVKYHGNIRSLLVNHPQMRPSCTSESEVVLAFRRPRGGCLDVHLLRSHVGLSQYGNNLCLMTDRLAIIS